VRKARWFGTQSVFRSCVLVWRGTVGKPENDAWTGGGDLSRMGPA
jgi:hypothetical protein